MIVVKIGLQRVAKVVLCFRQHAGSGGSGILVGSRQTALQGKEETGCTGKMTYAHVNYGDIAADSVDFTIPYLLNSAWRIEKRLG